jgi:hypothetical protein
MTVTADALDLLAGEVVDWQAIPVNVQAGREGGDLCRAAADFAKRRDLFAMPAPNKENHERNAVSGMEASHGNGTTTAQTQEAKEAKEAKDRGKSAPVAPTTVTNDQLAAPVGPNPTIEQRTADPEPPSRPLTLDDLDDDGRELCRQIASEANAAGRPSCHAPLNRYRGYLDGSY